MMEIVTDHIQTCSHCDERKECEWMPDPYEQEIYHDDTPMWICDECAYQCARDI